MGIKYVRGGEILAEDYEIGGIRAWSIEINSVEVLHREDGGCGYIL